MLYCFIVQYRAKLSLWRMIMKVLFEICDKVVVPGVSPTIYTPGSLVSIRDLSELKRILTKSCIRQVIFFKPDRGKWDGVARSEPISVRKISEETITEWTEQKENYKKISLRTVYSKWQHTYELCNRLLRIKETRDKT